MALFVSFSTLQKKKSLQLTLPIQTLADKLLFSSPKYIQMFSPEFSPY
jgi:hypothetical protein